MNIRNVHNTIPLHVALARGAKSCVGLLLSAGADCNWQVLFLPTASKILRLYIYRMLFYDGTIFYYKVNSRVHNYASNYYYYFWKINVVIQI